MTPSLSNFIWSLVAGGLIVVVPETISLLIFSQLDKIERS